MLQHRVRCKTAILTMKYTANFINFLKSIDVEAVPTDMTFGVSRDTGTFEWSGTSLDAVFAQRKNIYSPRMWRMIFDIVRFNQFALDLLHNEDESEVDMSGSNGTEKDSFAKPRHQESIGDYLDKNGYSDAFRDDYLIPMTAAVWSTSPEKCSLEFPAMTLVRFMWNHHLLSTVSARPSWMTLSNKSQSYIDAVMRDYPKNNVHVASRVVAVENRGEQVVLKFDSGKEELFDHVILACHGDTTATLVRDSASKEERSILDGFQTTENIAYLHSDLSVRCHYVTLSITS
jgi:predicted NAD/FAD-binding protein